MTADRPTPWWYSGDDGESADDAGGHGRSAAGSDDRSGLGDWSALLSGAARMVDWATSTVMAPHADHVDPADHPQCVVCRTVTLVGDPIGLMGGGSTDAADASEPDPAPERIRWIPVVDAP